MKCVSKHSPNSYCYSYHPWCEPWCLYSSPQISNQSEVQCTVHSSLSLSLSPILFLSLSLAALRHVSWLQAHIHTHMLAHISTHPALAGPALMTHQDVYRVAGSFIRARHLSYNSSSLQLEHSSDEVQERAVLQAPTTVRERWRSAFDFTDWLVLMNVSWHRDSEGCVWTCARKRDRWVQDLSGII